MQLDLGNMISCLWVVEILVVDGNDRDVFDEYQGVV